MSSVAEQKEEGILSPAVTEKITGRTQVETQQQRSKKNGELLLNETYQDFPCNP